MIAAIGLYLAGIQDIDYLAIATAASFALIVNVEIMAKLRGPVDAFFDKVLVNSEVASERDNRLRLLAKVRDAMGRVADFSQVTNGVMIELLVAGMAPGPHGVHIHEFGRCDDDAPEGHGAGRLPDDGNLEGGLGAAARAPAVSGVQDPRPRTFGADRAVRVKGRSKAVRRGTAAEAFKG